MTATPRYYPAEDAPKTTKKVVAKSEEAAKRRIKGGVETFMSKLFGGGTVEEIREGFAWVWNDRGVRLVMLASCMALFISCRSTRSRSSSVASGKSSLQ